MFTKFTNGCVAFMHKRIPNAFIFCIVLTIIVFIVAMPVTGMNPIDVTIAWGNGIWSFLSFSMQMVMVLVLGSAFASAPFIRKGLSNIADLATTRAQGIALVTIISMICCWLNWGFGLVVGALLAKEVARQVKNVDYRLLIASAYSGFVIWHAGISGSIPLQISTFSETVFNKTAGAVTESIPTSLTVFSSWNLILVVFILVEITLINIKMHPDMEHTEVVNPKLLEEEKITVTDAPKTPAEKFERSPILSILISLLGFVYLVYHFYTNGFSLSLDVVNLIFLILGILFHKTPINYVNAISEAVKGAGGIILQFPLYAGIMGMMSAIGPNGNSIAGVVSEFFVCISNTYTFPFWSFISSGIVNFFIPSGGGQWDVQAPILMPAGLNLGVHPAITAMTIAWGDAWTNMLHPFWALPALGIAGLNARDIMGFCAVVLIATGIILSFGFLVLVPMLGVTL